MSPFNTVAARAIMAAGVLAGATTAHALNVPLVGAVLDFSSYTASFSSNADGFDPSSLATALYVYDSPTVSAFSRNWTSTLNATPPVQPGPFYATGYASGTTLGAQDSGLPLLINADRYGEFTLGAGQSFSASIKYSLFTADAPSASVPSGGASVELQVLGQDGSKNYTDHLTEATKSLALVGSDSFDQGTLAVNFTNTGSQAETLRLALNANTVLNVSPVPEPASLAMMLAGGLGLSLLAARRHRRD